MADLGDARLWLRRGVFILLAAAITLAQMVPLDLRPATWAAPDLVLAMTCAWVVRRPDYVPVYSIALVFFATDLMLQRPPGLWAALIVVLTEILRNRYGDLRSQPFLAEWGSVALGLVAATLANRLILAIVLAPQAPLGLTLIQLGSTVLVYPVVVAVAYFLFGVARPAPGALPIKGQRS